MLSFLFVVVTLRLRSGIFSNNFEGLLVCRLLCSCIDHKDNGGINNFLNISSGWAIFTQIIVMLRFQNLVPLNQKFIQIAWSYNQLQKYLRHCTPVHVAYFGSTDLPTILCLWSPPGAIQKINSALVLLFRDTVKSKPKILRKRFWGKLPRVTSPPPIKTTVHLKSKLTVSKY